MLDHRIKGRGVVLAVGCVTAVISVSSPARGQETVSRPSSGLHDFDFLRGEWRVHHRRMKPGTQQWVEFEGTCSNRQLMDGAANMEEHALDAPAGAYRALALRAYDSTTGQWAIWWLDGRYPSGPLDPPVKGPVVADHADIRPLGTGGFSRRREDVGYELDHGVRA